MYEMRPEVKKAVELLNKDSSPKTLRHAKHVNRVLFTTLGMIFVSVSLLTYSLPENILDNASMFEKFVDFMANLFPTVDRFGQYSRFPQIAQLVFSASVVSIPFFSIPIGSIFYDAKRKESLRYGPYYALASILAIIFFLYVILYSFPGDHPDKAYISRLNFLGTIYYEKLPFVIYTSLALVLTSTCASVLPAHIFALRKELQKNNV